MRVRMAWVVVCLAAWSQAAEFSRYLDLVASGSEADQARGARVLVAQGTPALPEIRARLESSTDKDVRKRLEGIVAAIEAREPHGLRFNLGLPKMRLDLATINAPAPGFVVSIRNRGSKPVVLWPYFELTVLDANGQVVKPVRRRGRWGRRRRGGCYLVDVPFLEIAPGKIWSTKASLADFRLDASALVGWQLPAAGPYTLRLRYSFDRAAAKKRCDPKWKRLNDPKEPWNRALELTHTIEQTVNVAP